MQQQNFSFMPRFDIDRLVQESILGLLKAKTGIKSAIQLRRVEYITTFNKEEDTINISSVFVRTKLSPKFVRITATEINLSGATNEEFFDFVKSKGAKRLDNTQKVLELI